MNISIPPQNCGFIFDTFVINIGTRQISSIKLNNLKHNGILIGLNIGQLFVSLTDMSVSFYDYNTNDWYGPYNDFNDCLNKHVFGRYDGLYNFFKNNFYFNESIYEYELKVSDFVYNNYTSEFSSTIAELIKELNKTIKPIYMDINIFKNKTIFNKNVVEEFLIDLNNVFNSNNFNNLTNVNEWYDLARIDRGVISSIDNKIIFNLAQNRQAIFYFPKKETKNYFSYVVDDSLNTPYFIKDNVDHIELKYSNKIVCSFIGEDKTKMVSIIKDGEDLFCEYRDLFRKKVTISRFGEILIDSFKIKNVNNKIICLDSFSSENSINNASKDSILIFKTKNMFFELKNNYIHINDLAIHTSAVPIFTDVFRNI